MHSNCTMQCKECINVMNTANIGSNKWCAMVQLLIYTETKTGAIFSFNIVNIFTSLKQY